MSEPGTVDDHAARDYLNARALDRLKADGVTGDWGYERDPADLPARRWLGVWTEMIVWIEPPRAPRRQSR